LEREYKSRHTVKNNKDDLYQFIIHADRQNRALNETIYQAAKHFVLRDDEEKKVTDLSSQIEEIRLNYNRDLQKVVDKEAVYSVVNRDLELWRKQLTEIEENQVLIGADIEKKYDKVEQLAKNLLEDDSALKVIARYVEKENLSGVPRDYQEFYLVVSHELKKARDLLNEPKVDVEQADKVLRLLQEDLETLAKKTNELIKSSRLTEILIQNAIQYQKNNPSITEAIERAKEVYQQDCDYEQAVEIIAKELELIKPGTFQEIANNYNDQDQLKIQLNKH
jgi:septation ring formation regulator